MPCQWIGNTNIIKTSILPKAMRKRLGSDWTQTSGVPKAHQGQIMTEKGQEQVLRCRKCCPWPYGFTGDFYQTFKEGPIVSQDATTRPLWSHFSSIPGSLVTLQRGIRKTQNKEPQTGYYILTFLSTCILLTLDKKWFVILSLGFIHQWFKILPLVSVAGIIHGAKLHGRPHGRILHFLSAVIKTFP